MPTYDYECAACGQSSEIFQQITEAPRRKCPHCGKLRLKRLIGGGAGFLFRGSGFYITDYRSSDYKAKAKAEAGGDSSSEGGSKGKGGSSSKKTDTGATTSNTNN